ncbi:MAG: pirin family protein [Methanomassiliicoccus sp.]|nr:MAG: pirin family protein [Methanomassiliicoccus sp.]
MTAYRKVAKVLKGRRTSDGAGVKLTRLFSNETVTLTDPFLLLDFFGSDRPEDYMAGFPLHPHRGIETVTYMLDGYVDHQDSIGNKGSIGPGDVQWMTAGNGILHEEMPQRSEGWMCGLQLWVNLPRAKKMMTPRYRGVLSGSIPRVELDDGSVVKVIAGEFQGSRGPVEDLVVNAEYLDVNLRSGTSLEHKVPKDMNTFAMVYGGSLLFGGAQEVTSGNVAVFGSGDAVSVVGGEKGARFILVSGTPLHEPIAWGGPIVMNTGEELDKAFLELKNGTFIKTAP